MLGRALSPGPLHSPTVHEEQEVPGTLLWRAQMSMLKACILPVY